MPETPFKLKSNGQCPHCRLSVCFDHPTSPSGYGNVMKTEGAGDSVYVYSSRCPSCRKPIVVAHIATRGNEGYRLIHPFNVVRTVPQEVPGEIQEDFREAAAVLAISEKASAALSRRCLQNLLTDRGYKKKNLNDQIEDALKDLPARISENLDAIRQIGNFAAHPIKHKSTGFIVDVEPEEANWTLDVLEGLFEYYYVQPKIAEQKRKKLEAKLKTLGKPPLKKP